jgi:transposase
MVAIPTIEEEDARRPNRERQNLVTEQTRIINQIKAIFTRFGLRTLRPTMRKVAEKLEHLRTAEGTPLPQNTLSELRRHLARLRFVRDQIRAVEQERLRKLAVDHPAETKSPDAMVRLIARVFGVGVETADMLVNEIFSRHWRDRKAVARYAGLTGSPDESGSRRRERGLARAGNVRVRSGMIQLAWRFVRFQKNSALAQWFATRTADGRASTRKTMIVALARELLIALIVAIYLASIVAAHCSMALSRENRVLQRVPSGLLLELARRVLREFEDIVSGEPCSMSCSPPLATSASLIASSISL